MRAKDWSDLDDQGKEYAKLASEDRLAMLKREETMRALEASRRRYGIRLRREIEGAMEKVADHFHVIVSPLVDYRDYSVRPMATVQWMGPGGRFDFEALVTSGQELQALVRRVAATVKMNVWSKE